MKTFILLIRPNLSSYIERTKNDYYIRSNRKILVRLFTYELSDKYLDILLFLSFRFLLVDIVARIMSTKAIYEVTGKKLLNKYLGSTAVECRCVTIDAETKWDTILAENTWLQTEV